MDYDFKEIEAGGGRVEVIAYPDAHHSFDSVEPMAWLPEAVRLGRKHITLASNGAMYFTGSDGTRHPIGERAQREQSFEKANIRGAHVGGNWDARRASFRDAEAFWRERLLEG